MSKTMSHIQSLFAIRECRIAAGTDQHLLYTLALHCSQKSPNICWPSVSTLAEETGISVRTIQRSLLSLKRLGLIKVQRRMNNSNRYRIEFDVLAAAVESAKRERDERNKKVADTDFDGWDDDPTHDASVVEEDSEDEPEENEIEEDEDEDWKENFRRRFFATIDEAEDPRYLLAKIYPSSDPLYAEHTIMKTCKNMDEVRFVFEHGFLSGYYGQDRSRYEADWKELLKHKCIQCVGFEIRFYDHYACEDLKP